MTTYPGELSIADVMSLRREDRSSHTFLRIVSKGEARASLSYAEADVATLSVAHALLALGLSAGDRVMIATPNCLEQILAMFGTARTTLVNVPINAASAPAEISYLVGLTEPACVVVGPEQADAFDRAELPAGAVRVAVVLGPNTGAHRWAARSVSWEELIASGKPTALPPPAARDTFQLLPTSGTTSRPKAVIHSHTTRLRSAFRAVLHTRIRDDDVLLNTFPAFHINCLDSAILPALVTGATAVIFETFSASSFWRVVRAEQATVVSVIPTLIRAVAAQPVNPEERQHCVRLISGSLRPSAAELQAFLERFALSRYESGYGLTEAGNAVTGTNAEIGVRHPSMGVPLFDRTVELFDEQDQPVPEGATGELVIRCDPPGAVMDGYWNNPEATRAALRDGWLRTGDLARRDRAGAYYFVGRSKDVIKRSGENVGAEEVEAVLSDHPAVKEVAVIGVPDEYRDEAVMAFVVIVEEGDALTLQQLRAFCTGRLADFKVPTALRVVDELPRGLLGKTDKRALRSLAAADHPLARGTGDN